METSNAIIPSEAVVEVLTETIKEARRAYSEAHRTANIAQESSVKRNIDHWNIVSAKFQEKGDIYVHMATALANKHGIDYMQFSNGVPL